MLVVIEKTGDVRGNRCWRQGDDDPKDCNLLQSSVLTSVE
jgi:hypothetical protein